MGLRLTADEGKTALFDSVSGWAFGPVFSDADQAEDFLRYAEQVFGVPDGDVRALDMAALGKLAGLWREDWQARHPGE